LLRVASGVDPAACADSLHAAGVRLVSVGPGGRELPAADWSEPVAVVVGEDGTLAERAGDRVRVAPVDAAIRPPLAAEAAVVLFEAGRRKAAAADERDR
jgi:hypothetical protein